ncbi:unnamed protein product [Cyprideis torosa]|uniref:Regulator of telomere elongation helicase 1 homolog n=1 Tax=Cyprideis torosa TaxID=163714 RepID=A0A7R8ZL24_9CRUS|nr:unnamed protein product [Cyprideis torosa]CAG0885675.1 unnamed protein product [Cyprideis torosa]
MPELSIEGITVDFPFEPYSVQLNYMTSVIRALNQNRIVIFDEAHNIERMCEESASFTIRSVDVALAIDETKAAFTKLDKHMNEFATTPIGAAGPGDVPDLTPEDIAAIKEILHKLEAVIAAIEIPRVGEKQELIKNGGFMFQLLEDAGIRKHLMDGVVTSLDKVISNLLTICMGHGRVFQRMQDMDKMYKVFIEPTPEKPGASGGGWGAAAKVSGAISMSSNRTGKSIHFWCFSPGVGMQTLVQKGIRNIILTSGTLSPLSSFKTELGLPFNVELENPHIVTEKQVWVGVLRRGPDGTELTSTYKNRSSAGYMRSLGMTISNFATIVPHGLLVFFPSYGLLNSCMQFWQNTGVWKAIEKKKPIFVEPKGKNSFTTAMTDFYAKIKDPAVKGAIFMAVFRGKVSEGLDFADENGRAVVIAGIPFAPHFDPRITLKREYLDDMKRSCNNPVEAKQMMSGGEWYHLEAIRAVNQAIGRVIRHRYDFGAIILADSRFGSTNFKVIKRKRENEMGLLEEYAALRSSGMESQSEASCSQRTTSGSDVTHSSLPSSVATLNAEKEAEKEADNFIDFKAARSSVVVPKPNPFLVAPTDAPFDEKKRKIMRKVSLGQGFDESLHTTTVVSGTQLPLTSMEDKNDSKEMAMQKHKEENKRILTAAEWNRIKIEMIHYKKHSDFGRICTVFRDIFLLSENKEKKKLLDGEQK